MSPDYYKINRLNIYLQDNFCFDLIRLSSESGYFNWENDDSDEEINYEDKLDKIYCKPDKILYTYHGNGKWKTDFIKDKYLPDILKERRCLIFEEDDILKFKYNKNVNDSYIILKIIKHQELQLN
jgi:hypothetical protein